MARFRLLAGQFITVDRSRPILDAEGRPTGRYEERTYNAGGSPGANPVYVDSDEDLVAKHGANKFELVSAEGDRERIRRLEAELADLRSKQSFVTPGQPTEKNLTESPAHFPGGQVSTGFQASGGPAPPELAKKLFAEQGQEEGGAVSEPAGKPQAGKAQAKAGGRYPSSAGKGHVSKAEYHAELDSMTVKDLKAVAEAEEIDLAGCTHKDEIHAAVKKGMDAKYGG